MKYRVAILGCGYIAFLAAVPLHDWVEHSTGSWDLEHQTAAHESAPGTDRDSDKLPAWPGEGDSEHDECLTCHFARTLHTPVQVNSTSIPGLDWSPVPPVSVAAGPVSSATRIGPTRGPPLRTSS